MTLEETVEYFRDMVEGCGAYELCPCFHDDMEMTKIALSALEKQIPKKPREAFQSGFFWCPACSKANIATFKRLLQKPLTFTLIGVIVGYKIVNSPVKKRKER